MYSYHIYFNIYFILCIANVSLYTYIYNESCLPACRRLKQVVIATIAAVEAERVRLLTSIYKNH